MAGHFTGPDFIVMGNFLAGEGVLSAMVKAISVNSDVALEERLMQSLEAGGMQEVSRRPMATLRRTIIRLVGPW